MPKSLEQKLDDLRKSIRRLDSALVACSGEVDNAFLMRVCRQELGDKAVSLRALASVYPNSELSIARRVARIIGVREGVPESAPVAGRKMPAASRSLHTYSSLKSLAMRAKLEHAMKVRDVAEGNPKTDHSLIIFRHAGLRSPILESSASKGEIRLLAKELGLPNWEKQVRGPDDKAMGRKAIAARDFLHSLGFSKPLLEIHGRKISICVGKDEIELIAKHSDSIIKRMRALGFSETLMRLC